jgi:hypothetical protein
MIRNRFSEDASWRLDMTFPQWTVAAAVGVVWGGAALTVVVSLAPYLISQRHQGASRVLTPWLWPALLLFAGFGPFWLLGAVFDSSTRYRLLYGAFGAVMTVITLTVLGRAVRKRRQTGPMPSRSFEWLNYLALVGVLLTTHVMLVRLYLFFINKNPTGSPGAWLSLHIALLIIIFPIAQFGSAWAIKCLIKSFRDDWRDADGQPISRRFQYLAVVIPLLLCALVSAAVQALLWGILGQLALLIWTWRYTSRPPMTPLQSVWIPLRTFSRRIASRKLPTRYTEQYSD